MNRIVTDAEMDRRSRMANAQSDLTEAMSGHELTALEWLNVLAECQRRMIGHGLVEQWEEMDRSGNSTGT